MRLKNKKILLGVTGSIAAYKIPELIRLLQQEGATVFAMATPSAFQFVTKTTLQALTGFPVLEDLFGEGSVMPHIHPVREADMVVIAPATANTLAKLAYGMADDVLSATVLASKVPVLIAPAMNSAMWKNALVQENVRKLRKTYNLVDPSSGYLACKEYGEGRLVELSFLLHHIIRFLTDADLAGKKVLISGGATREYLDPVRFLSNGSSGKMAYCLAAEAFYRGAEVTVVLGESSVDFDLPVRVKKVVSTADMRREVLHSAKESDIFVAAAAVCDFSPQHYSRQKIKKTQVERSGRPLFLSLKKTPDILAEVLALERPPFTVGFALETRDALKEARLKMKKKAVDLLVLNTVDALASDEAKVSILTSRKSLNWPRMSKQSLSIRIFDLIVK